LFRVGITPVDPPQSGDNPERGLSPDTLFEVAEWLDRYAVDTPAEYRHLLRYLPGTVARITDATWRPPGVEEDALVVIREVDWEAGQTVVSIVANMDTRLPVPLSALEPVLLTLAALEDKPAEVKVIGNPVLLPSSAIGHFHVTWSMYRLLWDRPLPTRLTATRAVVDGEVYSISSRPGFFYETQHYHAGMLLVVPDDGFDMTLLEPLFKHQQAYVA